MVDWFENHLLIVILTYSINNLSIINMHLKVHTFQCFITNETSLIIIERASVTLVIRLRHILRANTSVPLWTLVAVSRSFENTSGERKNTSEYFYSFPGTDFIRNFIYCFIYHEHYAETSWLFIKQKYLKQFNFSIG